MFYGLGSDGTVGANKNSIKIIGEETDHYAQGYFVYDSKKAGRDDGLAPALRAAPDPLPVPDRPRRLRRLPPASSSSTAYDVLDAARATARTLLLNSPTAPTRSGTRLPREVAGAESSTKRLQVLRDRRTASRTRSAWAPHQHDHAGLRSSRSAGILPEDRARRRSRRRSRRRYAKKGAEVVEEQLRGGRRRARRARRGQVSARSATAIARPPPVVAPSAPRVRRRRSRPRSSPGTATDYPCPDSRSTAPARPATTQYEKRNIATEIPEWDPAVCIQCNMCSLVCPHAPIRPKVFEPEPARKRSGDIQVGRVPDGADFEGWRYTIQVAPEDCTGCRLCVDVLPGRRTRRTRSARPSTWFRRAAPRAEREYYELLPRCPSPTAPRIRSDVKGSQFAQPLFEYSGACAGCGETPYVKLVTQLFGDRTLIANATGCSSIYGGNLPDDAVHRRLATGGARPGRTRCSRTTRSSAADAAQHSTAATRTRIELLGEVEPGAAQLGSLRASRCRSVDTEAGIEAQRERTLSELRIASSHR